MNNYSKTVAMFALKEDNTLEEILNNSSDDLNVNRLLDYADTTSSCKLTQPTKRPSDMAYPP